MVGPLLGAIPAAVIALSISPSKLVWVIIATIVIQQLENSLLVPRVMRKAVGVNPFVSLLSIFAFSSLFGIAGALMAIPIAAIIQLLLDRFVFHPAAIEPDLSAGRDYASRLRYEAQDLAQDLRRQARLKKGGSDQRVMQTDQAMDEIEAITTDLDFFAGSGPYVGGAMTKRVVWFGLAVMITLLALVVLWQFRIAIVYVLISLTIAAALRPLVNRMAGRRFVVRLAWILLSLVALGIFGFLLFLVGGSAVSEIQHFAQGVSVQDAWRLPVWLEGSLFQQVLVARLPPPSKLFEAVTGSQGQLVLPAILGFTQNIVGAVSGVLVVLFLTIYWIINQVHFERLWLSLLPSEKRKQARDIWRTIEPDLGAYIRSQVIHSLLAGSIRPGLLGARVALPGVAGAGRRSGEPDPCGWGSSGGHSGAFGWAADGCAA